MKEENQKEIQCPSNCAWNREHDICRPTYILTKCEDCGTVKRFKMRSFWRRLINLVTGE